MPSALSSLLNVLPSSALLFAFGICVLSIPLLRNIALRSRPDSAVPAVGGLAFLLSVAIALTVSRTTLPADLLVGLMVVWGIGALDDRNALSPRGKTLFLMVGLWIHASLGEGLGLFENGMIDRTVQVLWLLWMCNAFNVLDAVDGLSAGVGALSLATFGILLAPVDQTLAAVCLSLSVALVGYLFHNFHPARVYMGDSGSLTIGFLLGTAAVDYASVAPNGGVASALLVSIPCFEALFLIVIRIAKVTSPTEATYDHPTQRLIVSGLSTRVAVLIQYGLSGVLCALAVLTPDLLSEKVAGLSGVVLFLILVYRIKSVDTAGDGVDARPGSVWEKTWLVNRLVYKKMKGLSDAVRGRLVDVGCGDRPYERLFAPRVDRYVGVDIDPKRYPDTLDAVTRGNAIGLSSECADWVLSNQVLEHVAEPQDVVTEMARLLKPGGTLILSAPHIWGIHEEPQDYYRFTPYGLRHLVSQAGLSVCSVEPLAGYWVTAGARFCYYLERFDRGPLRPLIGLFNFAIQALALVLDRLDRREGDAWNHVLIAVKPDENSKTGEAS